MSEKRLPNTNCLFYKKTRPIACDDYIKRTEEGHKVYDRSCCEHCGWNPEVEAERKERLEKGEKV